MSQPIRSSVRTSGRTLSAAHRPVVAEAIEGRQMFAAVPSPHFFGGPPHGRFEAVRAEISMLMTAVALAKLSAADGGVTPSGLSLLSVPSAAPEAAPAPPAARNVNAVNRAVPVTATAAKPEAVAVRHDDVEDAVQAIAPADTAAADADAPAGLTFGPFNVTTAMAATTAAVPTLTWVASTPSFVLRPDVTPSAANRTASKDAKPAEETPVDVVVDTVVTQQAALGLPTESMAERPLWQRISAAAAGVTLVAVNYVVRRRRRQIAATALR